MPFSLTKLCCSIVLVIGTAGLVNAQTTPTTTPTPALTPTPQPTPTPVVRTAGDIMRERISKAKAFIVVRNYNAAIFELESIRKESADPAVDAVVNVLLMNSYLEQGDYRRAQEFLGEFFAVLKTTKPNALESYMSVAGQIIKGARSRADRYRTLGLSITDRTLPLEASNDLERMRETLELVITQSKEIGTNKDRAADAMLLLEEASSSRAMLARDDYDARRWRDEVADTREQVAQSRAVVLSVVGDPTPTPTPELVAKNTETSPPPIVVASGTTTPPLTREREVKPPEPQPTTAAPQPTPEVKEDPSTPSVQPTGGPKAGDTIDMGSALREYATASPQPIYPSAARSMRASGIVTVEILVDEKGDVSKVEKVSGPSILRPAAQDAIRKWRFKPFTRDGQPVKATGFVNFNFKL